MPAYVKSFETPGRIKSDANQISEGQILEGIKDIRLYGIGDRGNPNDVFIKDIIRYTDKKGNVVYTGINELEDPAQAEYMDELFENHGTLCRETIGKLITLSTTKPNYQMHNSNGTSTEFQYRVYDNGREDLYFDAIPSGSTHLFFSQDDNDLSKMKKVSNPSLRQVVGVINPDSKLL
jgi:hypothetical protein